jgi:hypothetical protein
LVEVSRNGEMIEFRTFPDTQIKIMGHVLDNGPAYFEAWAESSLRCMQSLVEMAAATLRHGGRQVPLRKTIGKT